MNVTLFVSALRQRFTSRVRLVLVACVFLFPLLALVVIHGLGTQALGTGSIFALILAAGIIGQESSSGVMQLLFARPVRRSEYVVSRWLAVVFGAATLSLVQIGLACLIWLARGSAPGAGEIATFAAQQVINAFGTVSVVLLFSSFVSGIGDVVSQVVGGVVGQMFVWVGQFRQSPPVVRTGEEIIRFVSATVPLETIVRGGSIPWFEIVSYLSTVSLCVTVAIVVLNRREISYASD
jgi:ABC-type transport system involved in multi-copper enzyme maturation permease subunit